VQIIQIEVNDNFPKTVYTTILLQPFSALWILSGTTGWAGIRKLKPKPIWISWS